MKKRVALSLFLGLVGASHAQLSVGSPSFTANNISNVSGIAQNSGVAPILTSTSLVSKGNFDTALTFARQNGNVSLSLDYIVPLTIGTYPINFKGLGLSFDTSWIITGGAISTLSPRFYVSFKEQLGNSPNTATDPNVFNITFIQGQIAGNGRYSIKNSYLASNSRFLSPGKYYLTYGTSFTGTVTGFSPSELTPGLTIEAGGPHTPGQYPGLEATLNYEVAPEPSTVFGLTSGLGMVLVLGRRRRNK